MLTIVIVNAVVPLAIEDTTGTPAGVSRLHTIV